MTHRTPLRFALAALLLALPAAPTPAQTAFAQMAPDTPEAAAAPVADRHAAWTALLARYVRPGRDGVNRFDYGALKANAADRAALDAYIDATAAQDWETLTRDGQFAAWANLYNALTIRHIVARYPVASIRGAFGAGPWKDPIVTIGQRALSLDDIEHGILRAQWDDPRVHYSVNCASIGCPDIQPRAWEAATLDADLDAAARAYINHPRGVSVRADGRLRVSSIYKWFRVDFGDSEAGVIDHLLRYAEPDLAAAIRARPDIAGHGYDWSLNDAD